MNFSGLFNFSNVNIIDILSFIATAAIGIAAIRISIQSSKREKEMKKLDNKIAVMDKAVEVYNYFTKEIRADEYFPCSTCDEINLKIDRLCEIRYLSRFLFNDKTHNLIDKQLDIVYDLLFICPPERDLLDYPSEDEDEEYINYVKRIRALPHHLEKINTSILEIFDGYKLNL